VKVGLISLPELSGGVQKKAGADTEAVDEGKRLEDQKLKKACQEFEAVFWHQFLKEMRKTIPRGGFLGRSSEQALYTEMLDEQYALLLAERGFSGIGRILYEQLRPKSPPGTPLVPAPAPGALT